MSLKSTLDRENEKNANYIKLYKFTLGLKPSEAMMLSYLIDADDFVQDFRLKEDPGYFLCTTKGFINEMLIGWSDYQIRSSLEALRDQEFIFIKTLKDSRNSNYKTRTAIKLNIPAILKLKEASMKVSDKEEDLFCSVKNISEAHENFSSEEEETDNNKEQLNKKQLNKELVNKELESNSELVTALEKESLETSSSSFKNNVDLYINKGAGESWAGKAASVAAEVIPYLNEKTGFNYSSKTQETLVLIENLLKRDFTKENIITVIDKKCDEWLDATTKDGRPMKKYLRPETLFGPKFETYLNEQPRKKFAGNLAPTEKKNTIDDYIYQLNLKRFENDLITQADFEPAEKGMWKIKSTGELVDASDVPDENGFSRITCGLKVTRENYDPLVMKVFF